MKGIIRVILIALLATNVWCVPGERLKRNPNPGRNYGHESEEHDTSIEDRAPCDLLQDNSGSPEHGYDFDEYPNHEDRRISVNAASAASSSYS